jgi:LPS export ABC transporter protein LptC
MDVKSILKNLLTKLSESGLFNKLSEIALKHKKNLLFISIVAVVIIGCLWAFISAGIMTREFKDKITDKTYNNKEANIESMLVTETKDGQKLWELYADEGTYNDIDNIVILHNLLGNFYEEEKVKASFKADAGTYNTKTKEIILFNNVLLVYFDGTNISTERLTYTGKHEDIIAEGNVRIEKPNEAVVVGRKAVLSGDYKNFNIEGRTETHFYM